jgi:hypothetical protein
MRNIPCGDCLSWTETFDGDQTTGTCQCPDSPHYEGIRLDTDDGCEFVCTREDIGDGIYDHCLAGPPAEDLT